ncbi:MAG: hypothetical protein M0R03_22935 [Novosphingobium sp.]|nr:hypothetical protein [Novosphingobium sp.]
MNKEVKEFCKTYGLTVEQFYGGEVYKGSLNLWNITELPEGFNPTVGGHLFLNSLIELPEGFNPTVDWCLNLESLTELPEGFNPTVGGGLDLRSLKELPECFSPTLSGSLNLRSLTELPKGFNPTVGESLYLKSVKQLPEDFNPTVGRSLYLNSLKELPEGFNPTVGGSLYLNSLTELPEGFNPTVGGSLELSNLKEVPEGFNPTVGRSLFLNSLKELPEWNTTPKVKYNIWLKDNKRVFVNNEKDAKFLSWENGKYISVDGLFTKVVSHKGNVWKVKGVAKDKIFYLITDGNGNYSHGDTLQEAKVDLIFKTTNRNKEDYEGLTLNSELSYEEAIVCYRVITGACSYGTKDFIENRLPKKKETYTIAEIIELTKGEYGNNTFEEFFINNN